MDRHDIQKRLAEVREHIGKTFRSHEKRELMGESAERSIKLLQFLDGYDLSPLSPLLLGDGGRYGRLADETDGEHLVTRLRGIEQTIKTYVRSV